VDTPVYDRYALAPGATLTGPAIIEERESTTVAGPDARVSVDPRLTLILEPGDIL
jgi:N-methylhydantoinase A/oxoprolinase/acetone carboxylase beta subunit